MRVCVYVCMCMCVCVCACMCMCVCMCVYTNTFNNSIDIMFLGFCEVVTFLKVQVRIDPDILVSYVIAGLVTS